MAKKDPEEETPSEEPVVTQTKEPEPGSREARWAAFLIEARKVNPARFDAQKDNHEFDAIPDSFQ